MQEARIGTEVVLIRTVVGVNGDGTTGRGDGSGDDRGEGRCPRYSSVSSSVCVATISRLRTLRHAVVAQSGACGLNVRREEREETEGNEGK